MKRIMLATLVVVMVVATAGCGQQQTNDTSPTQQATSKPSQTTSAEAAKPTVTPSSKPTTLAPENTQLLESKLVSSSKTEQVLALVPSMREGKWSSAAVLPAGSTLTIDRESFSVADNGFATANATVTGPMQGKFILHLALVGDQWLIYRTEKKG